MSREIRTPGYRVPDMNELQPAILSEAQQRRRTDAEGAFGFTATAGQMSAAIGDDADSEIGPLLRSLARHMTSETRKAGATSGDAARACLAPVRHVHARAIPRLTRILQQVAA